jgi:SpoVK/Ycf46/Vps4 family AAA+-type ATPase
MAIDPFASFDPFMPSRLGGAAGSGGSRDSFKLGDKVVLSQKGERYLHQSEGTKGVVKEVMGYEGFVVAWGNGTTNVYHVTDLVLAESISKSKPTKTFDIKHLEALVLDKKAKLEIEAVLKQHKNSDKLFKEWGLGETIEYGKGMTFMFYGPPGTGKTWGATCIAKVMGTELLVISAAEIQSSEPGAANRNIQQAFKTAKEEGKVLFIDECDSLITSRADLGMVLAGEVNTLLTEIEKFEGVVVLATNRVETMDEALERRISLIVEFPFPTYEQRVSIWQKLLPKKLPLAKDVHVETLARKELSGGQIKNVILQAARLALGADKNEVGLHDFESATARVLKSKNLMGSASRYRQGVIQDYAAGKTRSSNVQVDTEIEDFLAVDEDENERN